MTSADPGSQSITQHELEQCRRANATGRTPVVFVHGLWLLTQIIAGRGLAAASVAIDPAPFRFVKRFI